MRRRRFFLAHLPAVGERAALPDELSHYARHVLRLPSDTIIELFDGAGGACEARLLSDGIEIIGTSSVATNAVPILLACPLLKGDRSDWLLEKLTELGVAAYAPLDAERAVIHELSANKRTRFERLIEAACRQSGRNDVMQVLDLTHLGALPAGVWLNPRATAPFDLVCDELFSADGRVEPRVSVAIGPEGGFSPGEEAQLVKAGWRGARLATHVLRAETAAVMAASVAAMRWAG